MKQITSRDNSTFKELHSLLNSKGIREAGRFLVFGEKAVREALLDLETVALVASSRHTSNLSFVGSQWNLTPELFRELDVFGTDQPFLVAQTPLIPDATITAPPQGFELVLALSDPANLGAALRSASAFKVDRVILLQECASPFHPKSVRASSGCAWKCSMAKGPSLQKIPNAPHTWGLDMNGVSLTDFVWPQNMRLVIGEEGRGLPVHLKQNSLSIPMAKDVESLNATIAASIAMYAYRQHFTS